MDVQDPAAPARDEVGRKDPHVSGETDEIRPCLVENPKDRSLVVRPTGKEVPIDGKRGQSALPGSYEAAGAGNVRDDRDDPGIRNSTGIDRVRDRLEVRPPTGKEDRQMPHGGGVSISNLSALIGSRQAHLDAKERRMHILWVILIGLIAGALARLIVPGTEPGGFIVSIILGIVGALVATYLGKAIGWYKPGESAGFIGATLGAIVVLVVYHLIRRRSAPA